MTVYGANDYLFSISVGITGSPSYPNVSYDVIYLEAQKYSFERAFKIRPKQTPSGDSYTGSKGKKKRTITLSKCIIFFITLCQI